MSVLRRYLFFLLAMCTALAVGIAVGGGPLRGRLAADTSTVDSRTAELSDQVTTLRRGSLFDDAVTSATTQRLVRNRLAGHTVALLVLPRVSDATVADASDVIGQAGATITVTAQVSADVINPAKKTYVESVADSSLKGRDDVSAAAGPETYQRIGALVARAYVGHGDDTVFDEEAADISAELQGARLISTPADPTLRGALVVVLAAGASPRSQLTTASNVISSQLVTAVAAASDGALVAAPPSSSTPGGLLNTLARVTPAAGTSLSTLNVIDSPAGRVAAVYALAATADGQPGQYGTSTSQVLLPPGLASAAD